MLSKAMMKYVMSENKNGYDKQTQSVYNNRIKNRAAQALKDLGVLAEKLPEKQQAQIFSYENLTPLTRRAFVFQARKPVDEEETQERRARLLLLCYRVLNEIAQDNAWHLAPDVMKILTLGGSGDTLPGIIGLKAIYLKGFSK
jgi:hypothetical protein